MLPVAVDWSSDDNALRYVLPVLWRHFSHNRANGPESETTGMLRRVRQVYGIGGEVISDCLHANSRDACSLRPVISRATAYSSFFLRPR